MYGGIQKEQIEFLIEVRQPSICKSMVSLHHSISGGKCSWKLSENKIESCTSELDENDSNLQYTYISTIEKSHNFDIKAFNPKPDFQGVKPTVIDICFNTKEMNIVLKNSTGKKDIIFLYRLHTPNTSNPFFNVYIDKTGSGVIRPNALFVDIIPSEINPIPPIDVTGLTPISIITTRILKDEIDKLTQCSKFNLGCFKQGISCEGVRSNGKRKFFYMSPDLVIPGQYQQVQNPYISEYISEEIMESYDEHKIFQVSLSKKNAKNFIKLNAISGDQQELLVFYIPEKILLQSHISSSGTFNIIMEFIQ